MAKNNNAKAELLYSEIDKNPMFNNNIQKEDRSLMNVPFHLTNTDLNSVFLDFCEKNDCIGLKGHRSVGGMRASLYNAMDLEGVKILTGVMQEFTRIYG
jgi:phosphoserine aminotransferase